MTTARKYQEMNITTASPMELVLMLYEECLRSLDRAEKAFDIPESDPSRIEHIGNNLLHAQDIITELAVSLDMDRGGDVAQHLQRLYDFMVNHLSRANVQKTVQPIRDVRKMMLELKEAWTEVAKSEQPRAESENYAVQGNIRIEG